MLRPLIAGLPGHLAPGGLAIVYAEGLGDERGPFIGAELERDAGRLGLDLSLRIISSVPAATALYTVGQMLAACTPSRLPELEAWKSLFDRTGATRYVKYLLRASPGPGRLELTTLAM